MNTVVTTIADNMVDSIEYQIKSYARLARRVHRVSIGKINRKKFFYSVIGSMVRRLIADTITVAAVCAITGLPIWVIPMFCGMRVCVSIGFISNMFYHEYIIEKEGGYDNSI